LCRTGSAAWRPAPAAPCPPPTAHPQRLQPAASAATRLLQRCGRCHHGCAERAAAALAHA
jgi:hypothetical protein